MSRSYQTGVAHFKHVDSFQYFLKFEIIIHGFNFILICNCILICSKSFQCLIILFWFPLLFPYFSEILHSFHICFFCILHSVDYSHFSCICFYWFKLLISEHYYPCYIVLCCTLFLFPLGIAFPRLWS